MSNNKNVKFINFEKLIDVLTEHRNKLKAYGDYISTLSDMAMLALDDESILANTKIEFRVKRQINKDKKSSNPRDLLDLLTSSGTPDEFARNLDSIQGRIEENRNQEKEWEEFSLKLDGLDNHVFIILLSRMIETIKEYKIKIDQKTNKLCQKI